MLYYDELIFYETIGPYIEFKPYVTLFVSVLDKKWYIVAGLWIFAGIEFETWLEAILGLGEYEWPIKNYILWSCENCTHVSRKDKDVKLFDIRVPQIAIKNQQVSIYVSLMRIPSLEQ